MCVYIIFVISQYTINYIYICPCMYSEDKTDNHTGIIGSTADMSLRATKATSIFVRRNIMVPAKNEDLRIVVGIDGSQNSDNAYYNSLRLLVPGCTLYLAHVNFSGGNSDDIPEKFKTKNVLKKYRDIANKMTEKQKSKIEVVELTGDVVSNILCDFVDKVKAQILIVGCDGMSAFAKGKKMLGSVSDRCVQKANAVVIVSQINEYDDIDQV